MMLAFMIKYCGKFNAFAYFCFGPAEFRGLTVHSILPLNSTVLDDKQQIIEPVNSSVLKTLMVNSFVHWLAVKECWFGIHQTYA